MAIHRFGNHYLRKCDDEVAYKIPKSIAELVGQAGANKGHGFAIVLALVGALQSLRSLRCRLPWALGLLESRGIEIRKAN